MTYLSVLRYLVFRGFNCHKDYVSFANRIIPVLSYSVQPQEGGLDTTGELRFLNENHGL